MKYYKSKKTIYSVKSIKNIYIDSLVYGISSLLDILPSKYSKLSKFSIGSIENDYESIKGDWYNVGKYIDEAETKTYSKR